MRAISHAQGGFRHVIEIGDHRVTVDEPASQGGAGTGPSPQELLAAALASCTAITMQIYAERKGWDVSDLSVECEFQPAERGAPTSFSLVLHLPDDLSDEQVEKLTVIAAKCPIHRTLEGEAMFVERVTRRARA